MRTTGESAANPYAELTPRGLLLTHAQSRNEGFLWDGDTPYSRIRFFPSFCFSSSFFFRVISPP